MVLRPGRLGRDPGESNQVATPSDEPGREGEGRRAHAAGPGPYRALSREEGRRRVRLSDGSPGPSRHIEGDHRAPGRSRRPPDFHHHQLRHTFATLLSGLADLAQAKEMLGHQDIKTTMRYSYPGLEKAQQVGTLLGTNYFAVFLKY